MAYTWGKAIRKIVCKRSTACAWILRAKYLYVFNGIDCGYIILIIIFNWINTCHLLLDTLYITVHWFRWYRRVTLWVKVLVLNQSDSRSDCWDCINNDVSRTIQRRQVIATRTKRLDHSYYILYTNTMRHIYLAATAASRAVAWAFNESSRIYCGLD